MSTTKSTPVNLILTPVLFLIITMDEHNSASSETQKMRIGASYEWPPIPASEPLIFSGRRNIGSQTEHIHANILSWMQVGYEIPRPESAPVSDTQAMRISNQERTSLNRRTVSESVGERWTARRNPSGRAGELNLGKLEDRAWLGGLIVGEGSSFNSSRNYPII